MKTIILTGGGTAGHIMPNVALIPELKKHFDRIVYIGSKKGMEKNIISKIEGVEFIEIEPVKFIRKLTLKNLLIPFKLLSSIRKCKNIIKEINPNIVFSKGGYVSVPVVIAASKCGVPVLSHESDYSFGLANKIIKRYATFMLTSFRDTCQGNKCIFTGSPIREEIFSGNQRIAKAACGFAKNQPTILIFGGSLGAKRINELVFKNIKKLNDFNIIHIVGKGNKTELSANNYHQLEFAENIWDYFALADLIVSRAGANSIFEILALRKPMLLLPLGKAQSRGDQIENALAFKKMGFASVLLDEDLSNLSFVRAIKSLHKNSEKYVEKMKKQQRLFSNKIIIEKILEVAKTD